MSTVNENHKEEMTNLSWLGKLKLTGNYLWYAVGCVIVIFACFLPYINNKKENMTLMEGTDGLFFLMLSVVMYIFIWFGQEKITGILEIVLTYLCVYEVTHAIKYALKIQRLDVLKPGFWLLLIGAVVLFIGAAKYVYANGLKNVIIKFKENRKVKREKLAKKEM